MSTRIRSGVQVSDDCLDCLTQMLGYSPMGRPEPLACMTHKFFDELRTPGLQIPCPANPGTMIPIPELFDLTESEKAIAAKNGWLSTLMPHGEK